LDEAAYAVERARRYGTAAQVAAKLGDEDDAYHFAALAYRWAVEAGAVTREEEA
jgi:hypothetical protein